MLFFLLSNANTRFSHDCVLCVSVVYTHVYAYEYCFYHADGLLPRFMRTNGNAARRWYIAWSPIKMFDRWVLLLASQINYAAVIDNFGLVSERKIVFLNLANQFNDNATSARVCILSRNFRSEDKEVSFTALFYDFGLCVLNPPRYWNEATRYFTNYREKWTTRS